MSDLEAIGDPGEVFQMTEPEAQRGKVADQVTS